MSIHEPKDKPVSDSPDVTESANSPLNDLMNPFGEKEECSDKGSSKVPQFSRNLLESIALYVREKSSSLADRGAQKLIRFQNHITDYASGKPLDIHYAQDADFILGFAGHLLSERQLSLASVYDVLIEFRKFTRYAIRARLIPSVDVFPYCYQQLGSQGADKLAKNISTGTKGAALRLIDSLERWSYTRLRGNGIQSEADKRRAHERATNYRCLALYLFGLYFYGLEIKDMLTLPRPDADGNVYVERYHQSLPLSPIARRLVTIYNLTSRNPGFNTEGQLLLSVHHSTTAGDSLSAKVGRIERRIHRVMKELRADLYVTGSILDDRISYIMECGLQPIEAQPLIKAEIDGNYANISLELLQRTESLIEAASNTIRENWYLLRLLPGQKMPRIKDELVQSGLLGDSDVSIRKVYDPIDWMTSEGGKINSPLSRFLFFKIPVSAVSGVASMFRDKCYVQRDVARHEYAAINEDELRMMQYAIRDFRDDIELIDKTEWLKDNGEKLKIGGQARIMSGSLKGMVATIIDITGASDTEKREYLLEYVAGAVTFKTRLHNVELDPIA